MLLIGDSIFYLILRRKRFALDLSGRLVVDVAMGMATIIIVSQISSLAGLSIRLSFLAITVVGFGVSLFRFICYVKATRLKFKLSQLINNPGKVFFAVIFILLVFSIVYMSSQIIEGVYGSGNEDAATHSIIISLILKQDRVALSAEPYYQLVLSYPVGSHIVGAYLSWLFGTPIHRIAVLLSAVFPLLIGLGVFFSAKAASGSRLYSLVAFVTSAFLTRPSVSSVAWGGLPLLMGLYYAVSLPGVLMTLDDEDSIITYALSLTLLLAAAVAAHTVNYVVVSLLLVFFFSPKILRFLRRPLSEGIGKNEKKRITALVAAIALAGFLSIPYFYAEFQFRGSNGGLPPDIVEEPSEFTQLLTATIVSRIDFLPVDLIRLSMLGLEFGTVNLLAAMAILLLPLLFLLNKRVGLSNQHFFLFIAFNIALLFLLTGHVQLFFVHTESVQRYLPMLFSLFYPLTWRVYTAIVVPMYFLTPFVIISPYLLAKNLSILRVQVRRICSKTQGNGSCKFMSYFKILDPYFLLLGIFVLLLGFVFSSLSLKLVFYSTVHNVSDLFMLAFYVIGCVVIVYGVLGGYRSYRGKSLAIVTILTMLAVSGLVFWTLSGIYIEENFKTAKTYNNIYSLLTEDDLNLLYWIREHIPANATILTGCMDGGSYIVALSERKAIYPRLVAMRRSKSYNDVINFMSKNASDLEVISFLKRFSIGYVYVGSRLGRYEFSGPHLNLAQLLNSPCYHLVKRFGNAYLFSVDY